MMMVNTPKYTHDDYDAFEKKMHERYPKMFSQGYGGFAIGPGWWRMIETLCFNINAHLNFNQNRRESLQEHNPYNYPIPEEIPQVVITQIKEKFGTLRFYYDGGDEQIDGMIQMAESMSAHLCEECGAPGHTRSGGWIRTLCDHHEQERLQKMKERNV